MSQAPAVPHSTDAGDLAANMAIFRRHLKAENVSLATITAYTGAVEQLDRFLAADGRPRDTAGIRRQDIEAFLADILERRKPSTANQRFRGCQRFCNYLVAEGELERAARRKLGSRHHWFSSSRARSTAGWPCVRASACR